MCKLHETYSSESYKHNNDTIILKIGKNGFKS